MRNIKFRAFDTENKFMFYSEDNYPVSKYKLGFEFMKKNEFVLSELYGVEEALFKQVDAVFMQYTGIKDKNGKEVYEGDIVTGIYDSYLGGDTTVTGPVEYDHEDMTYVIRNGKTSVFFIKVLEEEEIEVIGNIYENKDLLESEEDSNE